MKYIIFELDQPRVLREIEPDGYHMKTINKTVLQKLDVSGVEEEHPTMESAVAEIRGKSDKLKYMNLTVLPIFYIDYEGEIQSL